MKKSVLCVLLGLCLLMTGCGGSDDSGGTEQTEATSASTTAAVQTVESEDSAPEVTTPAVTEESEPEEVTTTQSEPAESEPELVIKDTYAEMITAFDNAYLGLPRADKIYVFQSTGESMELGGQLCYAVSCYDEHEGTLYYMCDFYITEDGSAVYRYYISDDKYVLLPESKSFAQMDPTAQTADEIFAVANRLYGYFVLNSLDCDLDKRLEVEQDDGVVMHYFMVTEEELDTKAELLSALSCYFSADIINSLMDSPNYREGPDGKLYTADAGRGSNCDHLGTVYELVSLTEDTAVFKGYATYSDEIMEDAYTEEYTYNAVKQDGRWVFTNFELPY